MLGNAATCCQTFLVRLISISSHQCGRYTFAALLLNQVKAEMGGVLALVGLGSWAQV